MPALFDTQSLPGDAGPPRSLGPRYRADRSVCASVVWNVETLRTEFLDGRPVGAIILTVLPPFIPPPFRNYARVSKKGKGADN